MIVVVTSQFPFGAGESFIEAELPLWTAADDVVLLPEQRAGGPSARPFPPTVRLDETLADRWASRRWLAWAALLALISPVLWRELAALARARRLNPTRATVAFRTLAQAQLIERTLHDLARREGRHVDVVYGYWLSAGVLAGALGVRRGRVGAALCRAHGTDLWETSRLAQYTPLVRQFAPQITSVHAVSASGAEHLARYGFTDDQRGVARLGVTIPDEQTPPSGPGELHVLTLSSMTPFKRLDKAAAALARLHELRPDLRLTWTHIGTGPLHDEVAHLAEGLRAAGVVVELPGALPHDEVLARLRGPGVDVVLNTSDSEGIPVSLMEGMAHGIPAVAPDVGGIAELVPSATLLPAHVSGEEVGEYLAAHVDDLKAPRWRAEARERAATLVDAQRNHGEFIAHVRVVASAARARRRPGGTFSG